MTYSYVSPNRRAKPSTKVCIGCGCLINRGLRCGPCRDVAANNSGKLLTPRRKHVLSLFKLGVYWPVLTLEWPVLRNVNFLGASDATFFGVPGFGSFGLPL